MTQTATVEAAAELAVLTALADSGEAQDAANEAKGFAELTSSDVLKGIARMAQIAADRALAAYGKACQEADRAKAGEFTSSLVLGQLSAAFAFASEAARESERAVRYAEQLQTAVGK